MKEMKRKDYAFQRQCDEKPVLYRAAQDTWYACMELLSWYCRARSQVACRCGSLFRAHMECMYGTVELVL